MYKDLEGNKKCSQKLSELYSPVSLYRKCVCRTAHRCLETTGFHGKQFEYHGFIRYYSNIYLQGLRECTEFFSEDSWSEANI